MSKEIMSTPVETGSDGSADLIADLLEFLLEPDDDESYPSDGDFAHTLNTIAQMTH